MSLYELRSARQLETPVLVLGLEGWIDAGFGASSAMAHLTAQLSTELLAVFDSDELIDHRARRPLIHIEDGVQKGITWPTIELRAGRDGSGRDVLLLTGPEPDMKWHAFIRTIVGLTVDMGVQMVVGLGAFPAAVPHTRPVRLISTASTAALAGRVGFMPGTIEVATSIAAALQDGFAAAGVPTISLWAQVPHYLAAMPYPAASAALVEGLAGIAHLTLDAAELQAAASVTGARLAQMIANSEEHTEMVRQLEEAVDATESGPPMSPADLPTSDELAAELERFLRELRGPDGSGGSSSEHQ